MSKDNPNDLLSPEIPRLCSSLVRNIRILEEEVYLLEKILNTPEAETPEGNPFAFFTREGIKHLLEGKKIFQIVYKNLCEDPRFRSGFDEINKQGEPEK